MNKSLNLAIVVLVTAFGALFMVDGIMTWLGNELFTSSVFTGLVGFLFVIISALSLNQTRTTEE